jgi:hypothetical protein
MIEKSIYKETVNMVLEDQDFIMRQVQQLAKGLGKFLGIDAIKDILQLEQASEENALSDEEIEAIVLITHMEEIQEERGLTINQLAQEVHLRPEDIQSFYTNERFPSHTEIENIHQFVENNQAYLV